MYRFDTLAIHAGQPNDAATGAVTIPIYQTSTFEQLEPGVHRGFGYARTEHPTRRALEECLASLEGARYGLAFASGMAAIHNVLSLFRHARPAAADRPRRRHRGSFDDEVHQRTLRRARRRGNHRR